jgi:hypothetical protein
MNILFAASRQQYRDRWSPADVNVEGVMPAYYKCFVTNKSKYDLRLISAKAEQWGAFHIKDPWKRNFDIDPPDLISAGHKPHANTPTFSASATDLDGISTYVTYQLMPGDRSLGPRNTIIIEGHAQSDALSPAHGDTTLGFAKEYVKSEDAISPQRGHDVTHWSTIMDNPAHIHD